MPDHEWNGHGRKCRLKPGGSGVGRGSGGGAWGFHYGDAETRRHGDTEIVCR